MIAIRRLGIASTILLALALLIPTVHAQEPAQDELLGNLKPWLEIVRGDASTFEIKGHVEGRIDGDLQGVDVRLARYSDEAFDLEATHADYAVAIRRRSEGIAFALPKFERVYVGTGTVADENQLAPAGITARLFSEFSELTPYIKTLQTTEPELLLTVLNSLVELEFDPQTQKWKVDDVQFSFPHPERILVESDDFTLTLERQTVSTPSDLASWDGYEQQILEREEIERTLCRGVRRAFEVLMPGAKLKRPVPTPRQVAHGQLHWVDGQRVALLWGTPEEIGRAHGELLRAEAHRCIDSVLYSFATVETIRGGVWFRIRLEEAYARLKPHIPERHIAETVALAEALGEPAERIEAVNVFPELFHCSGFAVFGSATTDGKLYHGRVLDYMTTIGLQDSCTTLIVAPEGFIPFANVGYAGFIGSVSGMNSQKISLGEMGGRGEGQWDGVPMATLMRRALEECDSLDEVKQLWIDSPRTCEYYYVFADGETRDAVGVAAVPESVEFINAGQGHERLGPGIPDTVVLSAGSRLETLRARVTEKHGAIDDEVGRWLMSRPVAMSSNLHNVLFCPEDGVMWVANASHEQPAAERPYVRIDLTQWLGQLESNR